MKNTVLLVFSAFVAVMFSSCTIPAGDGGQFVIGGGGGDYHPYQQHQPSPEQRAETRRGFAEEDAAVTRGQVENYKVTKFERGTIQVLLKDYPRSVPQEKVFEVRKKTAEHAEAVGTMDPVKLSIFASAEMGCKVHAQARMINPRHKVVQTVTVRPDEVPDNIRAKFE